MRHLRNRVRAAGPAGAAGPARANEAIQRHRGTDSDGFHHAPGIGLGVRRLSIIDFAHLFCRLEGTGFKRYYMNNSGSPDAMLAGREVLAAIAARG